MSNEIFPGLIKGTHQALCYTLQNWLDPLYLRSNYSAKIPSSKVHELDIDDAKPVEIGEKWTVIKSPEPGLGMCIKWLP